MFEIIPFFFFIIFVTLAKREELVTNTENGYFRIHLNKHKCVQTITCLSKKVQILLCFLNQSLKPI